MGRDTLLSATIGDQGTLKKVALVLLGALFIAAAAKVTVPMWPVPVSMQTLAILLVGFGMGSRLGAATVIVYLAQGAMGLPVFTPSTLPGIAGLTGPTGGFLIGFVGLAWLAGYAAEKGLARGVVSTAAVALVASALLYVPGILWPMAVAGAAGLEAGWVARDAAFYWGAFVAPFLLGDALKAVIAALVVTGAWSVLKRRA
ncbi:biotin transporter BioY [Roseicyclus mahoneyensis]|uniref:Biotin transporter n=1 Tax=Roseicyclus mahoneyensis TaxID=164332 RepID=A0A316GPR3_9RHOB|nr:biotin transporter BioY [Roseicyclus mahoneyensis]PWK62894.1 biotin transport system substrate-specific component [Roseicyclus mahoneyensis]